MAEKKISRRDFVKKTSFTAVGVGLLADPFLQAIGQELGLSNDRKNNFFDSTVRYFRPSDLAFYYLYFTNAVPKRNSNGEEVRDTLGNVLFEKLNKSQPAYLTIRIPQQHAAEMGVDGDPSVITKQDLDVEKRLFLSGFSYLSFELPQLTHEFPLSETYLFNWNQFRLLTTLDAPNYPNYSTVVLSEQTGEGANRQYPFQINAPNNALFIKTASGNYVPLTIFEVPYKLFLSPIKPRYVDRRIKLLNFEFKSNNTQDQYFKKGIKDSSLTALWSNELYFNIRNEKGTSEKVGPSFKILAYARNGIHDIENKGESLRPSEDQRKQLISLSRLRAKDGSRDIRTDQFKFSALGASTFLKYDNENVVGTNGLRKWEQGMTLGRDNYFLFEEVGVELNSGLKVIVVNIGNRLIKYQTCFMNYRYYIEFIEFTKEFDTPVNFNNIPFKKLSVLEKKVFVNKVPANTKAPVFCLKEKKNSKYPQDLVKIPFKGVDVNNNIHYFSMDLIVFLRNDWAKIDEKQRRIEIQKINSTKLKNEKSHLININAPLSFASELTNSKNKESKNTTLETSGLMLASFYNGEFESRNPVLPRLLFTKAKIPQLDGIELPPQNRILTYSQEYLKYGFSSTLNPSGIFLVPIEDTSVFERQSDHEKSLEEDVITVDSRIKYALNNHSPVKDIFTKGYKSTGSLINTDLTIDGISVKDQSLALKRSLPSVTEFKPLDFLGLDAEILGSIKLSDILETALGIQDVPINEITREVKKEFDQVDALIENIELLEETYNQYKEQYGQLERRLKQIPILIEDKVQEIAKIKSKEYISYIEKYLEQSTLYYKLLVIENKYDQYQREYETRKLLIQRAFEKAEGDLQSKLSNLKQSVDTFIAEKEAQIIAAIGGLLDESLSYAARALQVDKVIVLLSELLGDLVALKLNLNNEAERYIAQGFLENVFYRTFKQQQKKHEQQEAQNNLKEAYISPLAQVLREEKKQIVQKSSENIAASAEEFSSILDLITGAVTKASSMSKDFLSYHRKNVSKEINTLKSTINRRFPIIQGQLRSLDKIAFFDFYPVLIRTYQKSYNSVIQLKITIEEKAKLAVPLLSPEDIALYRDKTETSLKEILVVLDGLRDTEDEILDNLRAIDFSQEEENIIKTVKNIQTGILADANLVKSHLSGIEKQYQNQYDELQDIFEENKASLIREKEKYELELKQITKDLNNHVELLVNQLESDLKKSYEELQRLVDEGIGEEYEALKQKIDQAKKVIQVLKTPLRIENNYAWETTKFQNQSFGLLDFITQEYPKTEFKVDFINRTTFKLGFDKPLEIESNTFQVDTTLSNFKIDLLKLITINFKEIKYQNGTNVPEDFIVQIRDVQFGGNFAFIEAFQDFIKSIDKNLHIGISNNGVDLSYGLPLGNFLLGYLNFMMLKLSIGVHLPFTPKSPMLLKLGINSPENKFKVNVNGFPGRGYFQITANPKDGLTSVAFLMEFGGSFQFNVGVAHGGASLYAGIYFVKTRTNVLLKGYVICSGHLRILGLFNASLTFFLILQGNGDYLEGKASLRVSYRFSRWFKVSARVTLYKRFYGAPSSNSKELPNFSIQANSNPLLSILGEDLIYTDLPSTNHLRKNTKYVVIYRSKSTLAFKHTGNTYEKELFSDNNGMTYFERIVNTGSTGSTTISLSSEKGGEESLDFILNDADDPSRKLSSGISVDQWSKYFESYF